MMEIHDRIDDDELSSFEFGNSYTIYDPDNADAWIYIAYDK